MGSLQAPHERVSVPDPERIGWDQFRRAAWIRTGALGDLVVGLAGLKEMSRSFPMARLVVVGPLLWTELLQPSAYPEIEKLLIVERRQTKARVFLPRNNVWVESPDLAAPLHRLLRDCDVVVNTHLDSYRYGFAALRAGVPVRLGSAPASMAWLYTHTSPWFGKDPVVHERDVPILILEQATSSSRKFRRTTTGNRANLETLRRESARISHWRKIGLPAGKAHDLARARELTHCEPKTYVLINPTSSRREKCWPSAQFRALLERTEDSLAALGLKPLLIGASHESEWLHEVAGLHWPVVQPNTLMDLQDVLSGARMLLTNVSSMQFVAATASTPVLVIFGRANPLIWGPLGPGDEFILPPENPNPVKETIFEQERSAYARMTVERVEKRLLEFLRKETRS